MAKLKIQKNVSLKNLTTLKVGGKAKYFVIARRPQEVKEAVKFAKNKNIDVFVLGGGSDVLINDDGFPGLVIKYENKDIKFFAVSDQYIKVRAGAGVKWDSLVKQSVEKEAQGIECLSGIPGSVGGAPVQNIGAYGQELKDTFEYLIAYDTKKDMVVKLDKKKCKFGYRTSIFKSGKSKGRYIILSIVLKLSRNKKPTVTYDSLKNYLEERDIKKRDLKTIRKAVLAVRRARLENPEKNANAGSFFKNPVINEKLLRAIQKDYPDIAHFEVGSGKYKIFAGWLIEKAGWKGKSVDGAKVSQKNALVIINPEKKADAKSILELANMISEDIYAKFGVKMENEVQYIGF